MKAFTFKNNVMSAISNIKELADQNQNLAFPGSLDEAVKMEFIIVFEGKMDHETIKGLATAIESKMEEEDTSLKTKKLIFHIVVELLQNIYKYSDQEVWSKGIIILAKNAETYYVHTCNVVTDEKKSSLTSAIEFINSSSAEELKMQYESKVSNGMFNAKNGAGLGLIDIARKSKQKLIYNFEPLDPAKSFFLITVPVLK